METNKKFNPFDKVLLKVHSDEKWTPDLYSYYDDIKNLHWSIGSGWASDKNILPYEGNENLVGSTDEPDEEVRLEEGEWIMCASGIYDANDWNLRQFSSTRETVFLVVNGGYWPFVIRFKDFDPENMEETKKHILCVKNGKVVRYKG